MKITSKKTKLIMLAAVYAAFAALFLIFGLYGFIKESIAYKNGEIQVQGLSLSDFEKNAAVPRTEGWPGYTQPLVSTDSDPYLLYNNSITLNGLSFVLKSHVLPGEARLYYKTENDTEYTEKHSAAPVYVNCETGEYVFSLPAVKITSFRLDPVSTAGCIFDITDIRLNHAPCAFDYFVPSLGNILIFLFMPLVVFACANAVVCGFAGARKKTEADEKNRC